MWKAKWMALGLTALIAFGCSGDPDQPPNGNGNDTGGTVVTDQFEAKAPDFNADSAYAYVKHQVEMGPRIPNSPEHAATAAWIVSKFKEFGAQVQVQEADLQTHDGQTMHAKNIIASYNPAATKRIMVSAHWDSRPMADQDSSDPSAPVPGANDGASGVGVILELARQVQQKAPEVGVDFILFDAEDYGAYSVNNSFCLGSQYWARNKHKADYYPLFGINLDMVGATGATFFKEGFSMQYAQHYVNKVWDIARKLGYETYFRPQVDQEGVIDDHYYVSTLANIPMVEVIDRDISTSSFFPHWHKTSDDMSQISKESLKATGQVVLETLFQH